MAPTYPSLPAENDPTLTAHSGNLDNPHQTTLVNLTDTIISSPANIEILIYNSSSGKWENQTNPGGINLLTWLGYLSG